MNRPLFQGGQGLNIKLGKRFGAVALALCMTLQLLGGAALAVDVAAVAITMRAPMTGSSVAASNAVMTAAGNYTVTSTTWKIAEASYTGEPFAKETAYIATVTLTATAGNPFIDAVTKAITITGTAVDASSVALNDTKTVLTFDVVFPATAPAAVMNFVTIKGTPKVGEVLSLDVLEPKGAMASYQWQRAKTKGGNYEAILNQTANAYTVMVGDMGYFLRL